MVPIITVVPEDPADLWLLAAALNSPPLTAHAHRAHTGAALSPDAIKLSARQLAALPLPTNQDAWSRAAGHARQNDLIRMGEAMCDAYGVPGDELMAWWVPRLPKHR
jgi:hypothetical protein